MKVPNFIALVGCWCLLSAICSAQSTQRSLLIVASEQSQLEPLTHSDLRKVFLGIPVTRDNVRLKPLLNLSDPLAMNIFLQKVVFMSDREYKRQLVSRMFRLGDQPPREFSDVDELVVELLNMPGSLTFMWSDQFEEQMGLESLGILWKGAYD